MCEQRFKVVLYIIYHKRTNEVRRNRLERSKLNLNQYCEDSKIHSQNRIRLPQSTNEHCDKSNRIFRVSTRRHDMGHGFRSQIIYCSDKRLIGAFSVLISLRQSNWTTVYISRLPAGLPLVSYLMIQPWHYLFCCVAPR